MFASSFAWFEPPITTVEREADGIRLVFHQPGHNTGVSLNFSFEEAHELLDHLQAAVQVLEHEAESGSSESASQDVPF